MRVIDPRKFTALITADASIYGKEEQRLTPDGSDDIVKSQHTSRKNGATEARCFSGFCVFDRMEWHLLTG